MGLLLRKKVLILTLVTLEKNWDHRLDTCNPYTPRGFVLNNPLKMQKIKVYSEELDSLVHHWFLCNLLVQSYHRFEAPFL